MKKPTKVIERSAAEQIATEAEDKIVAAMAMLESLAPKVPHPASRLFLYRAIAKLADARAFTSGARAELHRVAMAALALDSPPAPAKGTP